MRSWRLRLGIGTVVVANISAQSARGTAMSANCKVMEQVCRTAFVPILINRSRRLVGDQWAIAVGKTSVRRKLARL